MCATATPHEFSQETVKRAPNAVKEILELVLDLPDGTSASARETLFRRVNSMAAMVTSLEYEHKCLCEKPPVLH
jgi:hypothetical protein